MGIDILDILSPHRPFVFEPTIAVKDRTTGTVTVRSAISGELEVSESISGILKVNPDSP